MNRTFMKKLPQTPSQLQTNFEFFDVSETYEFKVVRVSCHSALMDYIYDQHHCHTLFLENMSKIACRMKFKFGMWMLPVTSMCPILR